MQTSKFEAVLSLGSDCVPAYQLKRYFGKQDVSCFDWLAVPMAAIAKVFEDDGASFAKEMLLCFEGTSVLCMNYGVLYHHEFERDEKDLIRFNQQKIEDCQRRLGFMYRSFLELATSSRTLFIRWGGATNAPGDELGRRATTADDLQRLARATAGKIGHEDFHLAFVEIAGKPGDVVDLSGRLPANVSHHRMEFGGFGNMGDDRAWDELLAGYGLEKPKASGGSA